MKTRLDKTKAANAIHESLTGAVGPCLDSSEVLRYVEGPMNRNDRLRVDRHVATCLLCSDAIEGAEKMSPRDRREILAKVARPEQAPRRPLQMVFSRPATAAMLAAAALIISIGIWRTSAEPDRSDLYAAYFQPYPNSVPLVRSSSAPTPIEEAMQAYELSDYVKAEALLAGILKTEPDNETALFYYSICLLTQDRADDAVRGLDKLAESPAWRESARWYQAMAYLKSGETKAATELLRPIAASTGYFSAKATALLRELK